MRAFIYRGLVFALAIVAMVAVVLIGWRTVLDHYAGAWRHAPEDAPWLLSTRARALVTSAFADADQRAVIDNRVAVLSRGQLSGPDFGNSSRFQVDQRTGATPLAWIRARMREYAAGIRHADHYDAEYMARLLRQVHAMPAPYRARLFARDAVYDYHGRRVTGRTTDYVTNAYVAWLAKQAPDAIEPVVSVHPYRRDAEAALKHWAAAGVKQVSWLPVAQHIDLADARARECYKIMAKRGMTLYLPVGFRRAANGAQGWIDPRALRPALDAGVDVVVTIGDPHGGQGRALMPRLFALLRAPAEAKHLAIDLAGVLAQDRLDSVLEPLLQHPQFFSRLRYASDYPRPAVAAAIDMDALAKHGFIDSDTVAPLREIYDVNPLLCAFVTMRRVHLPNTGLHFPARVFFRDKLF